MTWEVIDGIYGSFNPCQIITGVSITAIHEIRQASLKPKAVDMQNGLLTFVVDEFSSKLTEIAGNPNWDLELYVTLNYTKTIKVATSRVASAQNSDDISYSGVNVMYVNLGSDIYCDVDSVRLDTSDHIFNPGASHPGIDKSTLYKYVGNEKNVKLHKQYT